MPVTKDDQSHIDRVEHLSGGVTVIQRKRKSATRKSKKRPKSPTHDVGKRRSSK